MVGHYLLADHFSRMSDTVTKASPTIVGDSRSPFIIHRKKHYLPSILDIAFMDITFASFLLAA